MPTLGFDAEKVTFRDTFRIASLNYATRYYKDVSVAGGRNKIGDRAKIAVLDIGFAISCEVVSPLY